MFSYFGAKARRAPYYQAPLYDTIIEPFAGSARYALHYATVHHHVILRDSSPKVIAVWHWLQTTAVDEIANIPIIAPGQRIPKVEPSGKRWFMAFTFNQGTASPHNVAGNLNNPYHAGGWSSRLLGWYEKWLPIIRKWDIAIGDYTQTPHQQATWFIDPPYSHRARAYHEKWDQEKYGRLAVWCRQRIGQVIVTEDATATWLPFQLLAISGTVQRNSRNKSTAEGVWYTHQPLCIPARKR